MSLVKIIDGVPTYSTIQEALDYGASYGITGHHTHIVNGQVTYMAGTTHDEITSIFRLGTQPVSSPTPRPSGGSTSSGGGGY